MIWKIRRVLQGVVVAAGLAAGGYALTKPGSDVGLLPLIFVVTGLLFVVIDPDKPYWG